MNNLKPNPIFARDNTLEILDGWEFSFDNKKWQPINVPFCPQSRLSGIGYTDFIRECFYRRKLTAEANGKRIMLHFGAVDYHCSLYVNGKYVGGHTGGYTPFALDITDFMHQGENDLLLCVYDEDEEVRASGKQCRRRNSFGCFYTRTTGIWQPVWLEWVPENYIDQVRFYPNIQDGTVEVDLRVKGEGSYCVVVSLDGETVGTAEGDISYQTKFTIPLSKIKLWVFGEGNLYDVHISYNGDVVTSYFGLREVCYRGYDFLLNGKPFMQKTVLDQGFNPDGIYTSPSLEAMQRDIDIALDLGFNGSRLHQKVFDPRFLYLCDKAGYTVWGEFPSWGLNSTNMDCFGQFLAEWTEMLKRDFNHPSIIIWCPLNEVWAGLEGNGMQNDPAFIEGIFGFTKAYDSTRPCVDVSGGFHGRYTDLFDFHCYESFDKLKEYLDRWNSTAELEVPLLYAPYGGVRYTEGQPVNVSEYGGIALCANPKATDSVNEGAVQSEESWGYGTGERDGNAFVERYRQLTELLFQYPKLSGFCYTQLYDIEQEQNGFYNYDRSDKLTKEQKEEIRRINLNS